MHIQKYIFPFLLCLSLALPVSAVEDTGGETETVVEETAVENTENVSDSSSDLDSNGGSGLDSGLLDDTTLVGVETYGLAPVTPSDTTALKSVLLEFIGDYDPVILEYEYENSNGYSSFVREIQPDYVWLASCAMLALFVLSVFKLGGAILCRR